MPLDGTVGPNALQFGAVDLAGGAVSGVLPLADGGTGATTAPAARTALGAQATLDATNLKTLNNQSLLGSGNIDTFSHAQVVAAQFSF